MSIDELVAKMHAAEGEYVAGGYEPGVCARLTRAAEARQAVNVYHWNEAQNNALHAVYDVLQDAMDHACGIVRSEN